VRRKVVIAIAIIIIIIIICIVRDNGDKLSVMESTLFPVIQVQNEKKIF